MTHPRIVAALATLFALTSYTAHAQGDRCGAGKDLVVQALERAGPQSPTADFEDALQLLKRAAAVCSELGDAWYYRGLVEARLGHTPQAKFAADKARLLGSDAQNENLQPFILATPPAASRGFTSSAEPEPEPQTASAQASAKSATAGPVQQKWALVVGLGHFADHAIPSLHYTTADATSFASLLSDPAVGRFPAANVHVLTDAQATTQHIKQELNWIARHAAPNDLVVIYFATHGSPRTFDSVGNLNYLITYDTQIGSAAEPDQDALYSTALPMIDLSSAVATRMRALRTLVVLDTCYSGGSIRNSSASMMGTGLANAAPSPQVLQRISEGTGRIVLAASRVDQESLESDTLQHGYFTYFLLKALRQGGGLTPLTQVFSTVQQQVAARVAADFPSANLHQNPVMDRSTDQADFSLGTPAAIPQ